MCILGLIWLHHNAVVVSSMLTCQVVCSTAGSCNFILHPVLEMRGAASRLTHAHRQPIRLSLAGKKLWARRHGSALRRVAVKGTPTDVFVLDFDGVLVDSEPEVRLNTMHNAV